MKYMGSKKWMLSNGLGDLIDREINGAARFVDLFSGSGTVSIFVAMRYSVAVRAFDLQRYSQIITNAVINRTSILNWSKSWYHWFERAHDRVIKYNSPSSIKLTVNIVNEFRTWCDAQDDLPITKAYGGHYLSPSQSVWIDALRATLPRNEPQRTVALASIIQAASNCVAAPGHTAQPFKPSRSGKPFLQDAWSRDIVKRTKKYFSIISSQHAVLKGCAEIADANDVAKQLNSNDLVFIDPPYSGVHYSRFYHVLESISIGKFGPVSGIGRYPSNIFRPRSKYSVKSESNSALDELLCTISERGAKVILTYPAHECSNGLSGKSVCKLSDKYFKTEKYIVKSKFSTLGGSGKKSKNGVTREARQMANELILLLKPR